VRHEAQGGQVVQGLGGVVAREHGELRGVLEGRPEVQLEALCSHAVRGGEVALCLSAGGSDVDMCTVDRQGG
jgi:hypothetical protein